MIEKKVAGLIFALLLLFTGTTYGQAKRRITERDTTKQWEIGLDLLWLIDKNQVPATSIFTRYNFSSKTGKLKGWRLRVGIDDNYYDSSQVSNLLPHDINTFSLMLRPGLEFQKKISEKVLFFYGTDLHFFMFHQTFSNRISIQPDPSLYEGDFKTIELGIMPFLGVKYSITDWCNLSIESSLNSIYRIRRDKSETGTVAFPGSGGQQEINVDEFKIYLSPITVINLSLILN